MPSKALLDEKIRRNGLTQKRFCDRLGISRVGLADKLAGVYPFKASEIEKARSILKLSESEAMEIFGEGDTYN